MKAMTKQPPKLLDKRVVVSAGTTEPVATP